MVNVTTHVHVCGPGVNLSSTHEEFLDHCRCDKQSCPYPGIVVGTTAAQAAATYAKHVLTLGRILIGVTWWKVAQQVVLSEGGNLGHNQITLDFHTSARPRVTPRL